MSRIDGRLGGFRGPHGAGMAPYQSALNCDAVAAEISIGEVTVPTGPNHTGAGGLGFYFEEAAGSPAIAWGEWQSAASGSEPIANPVPASFTFTESGIYGVTVVLHIVQLSGTTTQAVCEIRDSGNDIITATSESKVYVGSQTPYAMTHVEAHLDDADLPATVHISVTSNGTAGIVQNSSLPWYRRCTIVKK